MTALWDGWMRHLGIPRKADFYARRCAVAARVTPSDCAKCGGEDFIHGHECRNALRGVAAGSTAIALGNDVKKYADRLVLMAQLKVALAPHMTEVRAAFEAQQRKEEAA